MKKTYVMPEFELCKIITDVVLASNIPDNLGEGDWGCEDVL